MAKRCLSVPTIKVSAKLILYHLSPPLAFLSSIVILNPSINILLVMIFVNDASSARPDGSMEVVKLYWFQHNCKDGQYSSAKVHKSVQVRMKNLDMLPTSIEDYEITLEPLPGLEPEVVEGM